MLTYADVCQVFLLARHDWQQCIDEAARRSAECADRVGVGVGAEGAMGLGGCVTLLDGLPGMRTGNRSEGTSVCSGHAAGFAVSPAAAGALRLLYCCTTAASALLLYVLLYYCCTRFLPSCGCDEVCCSSNCCATHYVCCGSNCRLGALWFQLLR
jgi:hypothetical protein